MRVYEKQSKAWSIFSVFILVYFSLAGIFVALALRFDVSRGKGSQYFKSAFLGYTVGLVLTIVVMNWFQAAQVNYSWPSVLSSLHVQLYPVKVLSCGYTHSLSWETDNLLCSLCFQPALLYIVPAVIGFLATHCIWNGEVKPVCSPPLFDSLRHYVLGMNFLI